MFKFGQRKSLQIEDPEPIMRSKSNSFSLVSPRPHHSISFNTNPLKTEKPVQITNNNLKYGRKTLAADFADTLLNLEIDIELDEITSIETFQQLITLYMDGVEYYESIKDRKFIYFQRKLNALMTKPAFLMSTSKQISPHKTDVILVSEFNASISDTKKKEFLDQQKQLELNLIYGDSESKEAKVNEIVQNHSDQVKRIDVLIQHDIDSQEDAIKKRLEKRRKSGMLRNFSLPQITIEESTLRDIQILQSICNNPQDQKVKDNTRGILAIEEEEDEEGCRKESIKKLPRRNLKFELNLTSKVTKRHSLLVGQDVINQLLKRQNQKKERSTSFPSREYLKVIFKEDYTFTIIQDEKHIINKELQEAHLDICNVYQKVINKKSETNQFNL